MENKKINNRFKIYNNKQNNNFYYRNYDNKSLMDVLNNKNLETFKNVSSKVKEQKFKKPFLEVALNKGKFDIAEYIIKSKDFKSPYDERIYNNKIFYKQLALNAVKQNKNDIVIFLLPYCGRKHKTILKEAVKRNNMQLVKHIESLHKISYHPLAEICICNNNIENAKYFIDKGKDDISFKSLIWLCGKKNNSEIATYIIDNYLDKCNFNFKSIGLLEVANIAAMNGDLENLKHILEKYGNEIYLNYNVLDDLLRSAIIKDKLDTLLYIKSLICDDEENIKNFIMVNAVKNNSIKVFKYFSESSEFYDYDIDDVVKKFSCSNDSLDIIKYSLDNMKLKYSSIMEIFENSISNDAIKIFKYFVEVKKFKYNNILENVLSNDCVEIFKYIIDKIGKTNPNKIAEECVKNNSIKILRFLLNKYETSNNSQLINYINKNLKDIEDKYDDEYLPEYDDYKYM